MDRIDGAIMLAWIDAYRLSTKDVSQHINYQYNHWIFFYIFVGIKDAVFLFQKIKEHFVLLRAAYCYLLLM